MYLQILVSKITRLIMAQSVGVVSAPEKQPGGDPRIDNLFIYLLFIHHRGNEVI